MHSSRVRSGSCRQRDCLGAGFLRGSALRVPDGREGGCPKGAELPGATLPAKLLLASSFIYLLGCLPGGELPDVVA